MKRPVFSFLFFFISALPVYALDLNTAVFTWSWEDLAPEVKQEGFRMKCGTASNAYTTTHQIADPVARSLEVNKMLSAGGNYFCAVYGYRGSIESGASNEVNFVLTVPGAPSAPGGPKLS